MKIKYLLFLIPVIAIPFFVRSKLTAFKYPTGVTELTPGGKSYNNPGNIKANSGVTYVGEDGDSAYGYTNFKTLQDGYRAMIQLLRHYYNEGYVTIAQIITHYAPDSPNLQSYIDFVSTGVDFDPNKDLAEGTEGNDLYNGWVMNYVQWMGNFEQGWKVTDQSLVADSIYKAYNSLPTA